MLDYLHCPRTSNEKLQERLYRNLVMTALEVREYLYTRKLLACIHKIELAHAHFAFGAKRRDQELTDMIQSSEYINSMKLR